MPRSLIILTYALSLFVSSATGQQASSAAKKDTPQPQPTAQEDIIRRSFEALIRERDSLTDDMNALTNDIWYVNDAIARRNELKTAEHGKKDTSAITNVLHNDMESAHLKPGTSPDHLEAELTDKKQLQQVKHERRNGIDAELERRADVVGPQQTFKLEMSFIFAALVAVVIVGFFLIAFRDESVRKEIFAGQAGIQFVTLFSLVIAIILFGIIEILEGRELAALLGGLSGYILGRSTTGTLPARPPSVPVRVPVAAPARSSGFLKRFNREGGALAPLSRLTTKCESRAFCTPLFVKNGERTGHAPRFSTV